MEDLLKLQIHENCKLAIPEGLKDLMADISREVLRYQPTDTYKFIADYLGALLAARVNLTVTAQVCGDICNASCNPELEDEFRYLGLNEEECDKAVQIIQDSFENGTVNENNLLQNLSHKINLERNQLAQIKEAINRAFARHKANNTVIYQPSSSEDDADEVTQAARHTLKVYLKTSPSAQQQKIMAGKIQAAYRACSIKRAVAKDIKAAPKEKASKILRFLGPHVQEKSSQRSSSASSESYRTLPDQKLCGGTDQVNAEMPEILRNQEVESKVEYLEENIDKLKSSLELFKRPQTRKQSISFDYDQETEVKTCSLTKDEIDNAFDLNQALRRQDSDSTIVEENSEEDATVDDSRVDIEEVDNEVLMKIYEELEQVTIDKVRGDIDQFNENTTYIVASNCKYDIVE